MAHTIFLWILFLAMYVVTCPFFTPPQLLTRSFSAVDVIISLAWFAAFGILVNAIHKFSCGSIWHWGGLYRNNTCSRWKAAEAFSFISAIVWLASALVVCFVTPPAGY